MQHEDPRLHLAREWLDHSAEDLDLADLHRENPAFSRSVAYHSQQAVEKALKAYLVWRDVPYRKTHELASLVQQCAALDPDFRSLPPRVGSLSRYAITGRYPQTGEEINPGVAAEALSLARETVRFILDRLPPEARSPRLSIPEGR